jgi:hypothetical protein
LSSLLFFLLSGGSSGNRWGGFLFSLFGFLSDNFGLFLARFDLFLEHLLYAFLLFKQKSSENAISDGTSRSASTIGTVNALFILRKAGILVGAKGRNSVERDSGISTAGYSGSFGAVKKGEFTTRSLYSFGFVRLGVVRISGSVMKALRHDGWNYKTKLERLVESNPGHNALLIGILFTETFAFVLRAMHDFIF